MKTVWRYGLCFAVVGLLTASVHGQNVSKNRRTPRARTARARASRAQLSHPAANPAGLIDLARQLPAKKGSPRNTSRNTGALLDALLSGKRPAQLNSASVDQLQQLMKARQTRIADLVKQLHASHGTTGKPSPQALQQARQLQQLIRSPEFARLRAAMAQQQAAQGRRAPNTLSNEQLTPAQLQRRLTQLRRRAFHKRRVKQGLAQSAKSAARKKARAAAAKHKTARSRATQAAPARNSKSRAGRARASAGRRGAARRTAAHH